MTYIFVPKHPLWLGVDACVGIKGVFHVERIHRSGLITFQSTFDNLLTNTYLDTAHTTSTPQQNFFSANASYSKMGVGTGSTTPAFADTTLDSEISPANTNRTQSNGGYADVGPTYVSGPPDYWYKRFNYVFDYAQGNGNLTELGIFSALTGGSMYVRQLFKDSGGTPTTVVKTSDDLLRVIYEIRVYPPQSDVLDTITISGQSYDIVTRAAFANVQYPWFDYSPYWNSGSSQRSAAHETQTLGARTSGPTGTQTYAGSNTISAYTSGNYYRDIRTEYAPNTANYATGIGSIKHGIYAGNYNSNSAHFQTSFDPKLPKDATKRLRLDVRYSFDRV